MTLVIDIGLYVLHFRIIIRIEEASVLGKRYDTHMYYICENNNIYILLMSIFFSTMRCRMGLTSKCTNRYVKDDRYYY